MIQGGIDWFRRNNELHGWAMVVLAGYTYLAQGGRGYIDDSFEWISIYGFKLKPSDIEAAKAIGKLPWSLKFIIGLISDNLPIMGYNVKPYMFLMSALGFVAVLMMGMPSWTSDVTTLTAAYLVMQFYGSSADCLTDALVIKNGQNDEEDSTSSLQSISWFMLGIGAAVFRILGGYLSTDPKAYKGVSLPGARTYNLIMAIFPLGLFVLLFFVKEEKSKIRPGFKALGQQLIRLVVALFSPPFIVLRLIAWLILTGAAGFSLGAPSKIFNTSFLKITPAIQSWITASGYVFLSIGVFVYYRWFRHTSFRYIYGVSQVLVGIFGLLDYALVQRWNVALGIPDVPFLFFSGAISEVMERLNSMPFLVMAGQLCPPNMEATFFSALMSISNQGTTIGQLIGAEVQKAYNMSETNLDGYGSAILIRVATTCACVLFIWLIPDTNAMNPTNAESIKPTNPTLKAIFKWAGLDQEEPSKIEEGVKEIDGVKSNA
ncbi:folate-biopterin transporter [Globomyces pollinis-pini]|nr:folate-biopterin transporter [Globomyces pollinis-pini]